MKREAPSITVAQPDRPYFGANSQSSCADLTEMSYE